MPLSPVVVVALGLVAALGAQAAASAVRPVRVMTWNAWNHDDGANWEERKKKLAATVLASAADVVAWQELRLRPGTAKGMMNDLAELLPHLPYTLFQSASTDNGGEGVGLSSRYPIIDHAWLPLRNGAGTDLNKRKALYAAVDVPGAASPLSVFNAHISYDKEQQLAQTMELASLMEARPTPQVLMGDLNFYDGVAGAEDASAVLQRRNGRIFLRDAWIEWKSSFPLSSADVAPHPDGLGRTHPAWPPYNNRCDRIYVRGPGLDVVSVKIVGRARSKAEAASDHAGLVGLSHAHAHSFTYTLSLSHTHIHAHIHTHTSSIHPALGCIARDGSSGWHSKEQRRRGQSIRRRRRRRRRERRWRRKR